MNERDKVIQAKLKILELMEGAVTSHKGTHLGHLQVGDRVTRMLAGTIPIKMIVVGKDDKLLTCSVIDSQEGIESVRRGAVALGIETTQKMLKEVLTWEFLIDGGGEYDPDLGWDGKKATGSYILEK